MERSVVWAKIHRNPRSLPAISTGLYWKGLNPPWVQERGEGAGMGSADTWLPTQDLHFPSGNPPWTSSPQPCLPCFSPHRASTHTGQEEKENGMNSAKNCKVAKPRAALNLQKTASLRITALQCSHGQLRKVWRETNQQKTLDLSQQDSRWNVFNYRLCVLACALSLFQRGWQCSDHHSSMSLLSHLSDTPRQDQRSEIWVLCAESRGLPACPIPPLCCSVFTSLALLCFSPMRVPALRSLPSCSSTYMWAPQQSAPARQWLFSQPSSVLTVSAFLLQKSLSWKEECVHKKANVSSQLHLCWSQRETRQCLEQHQEITQFLYLCTNGVLLPFCSARESCHLPHSTQSHYYLFSNTRQSHQSFFPLPWMALLCANMHVM